MARKRKSPDQLRGKMNLTIHPEIRAWAEEISFKRRRSVSQLFEDLVEMEWNRQQAADQNPPLSAPVPQPQPAPYFHQPPPYYYAPPTPQTQ
jgi:hypothetical protein